MSWGVFRRYYIAPPPAQPPNALATLTKGSVTTPVTINASTTPTFSVVRAIGKFISAALGSGSGNTAALSPSTATTDLSGIVSWVASGGASSLADGLATADGTKTASTPSNDTTGTTDILTATNFGVSSGSTVVGIEVTVTRKRSTAASTSFKDNLVRLTKDGSTAVGSNKADTATAYPTSFGTVTYGGPTDLWGTTWTQSEVQASTFGLMFASDYTSSGNFATASVDQITLKVYYTDNIVSFSKIFSSGGTTTNKSVSITSTPTFSVVRRTNKPLSITSTLVATVKRATNTAKSIASTLVATVVRSTGKVLSTIGSDVTSGVNYDFTSNVTGWTVDSGTFTWQSGGFARLVSNGTTDGQVRIAVPLVYGHQYRAEIKVLAITNDVNAQAGVYIGDNTSAGLNAFLAANIFAAGTYAYYFSHNNSGITTPAMGFYAQRASPTTVDVDYLRIWDVSNPTPVLVRSVGKPLSIASTLVGSIVRSTGKLVNAVSTPTFSLARAVAHKVNAVTTPTFSVIKALTKTAIAITSTPVGAVFKQANKAFTIASTEVATLVRQAGKLVNASSTGVASRGAFAISKLVNAVSTPTFSWFAPYPEPSVLFRRR
jgi:hypothetical protein